MECIKQVYENVPELDRFLTSEHDSACGIGNNDWDLKEEISCRLSSYLIKAVRDEAFALDWLDVLRMRKMPWFSRVWVGGPNVLRTETMSNCMFIGPTGVRLQRERHFSVRFTAR